MYNADPKERNDIKRLYDTIIDFAEERGTLFEYVVRDLYNYHYNEG